MPSASLHSVLADGQKPATSSRCQRGGIWVTTASFSTGIGRRSYFANSATQLPGIGVSIHGLAKTFRTLPPANLMPVRIFERIENCFQLCFVFRFDRYIKVASDDEFLCIEKTLGVQSSSKVMVCLGSFAWTTSCIGVVSPTLNRKEMLYFDIVFRALVPKKKRSSESALFSPG